MEGADLAGNQEPADPAARSLSDLTDRREEHGFRDKFIDLMRRIARYLTNQIE